MRRWDLICVGCALLAVTLWITGSSIHRFHNSDTLVACLISLYRWTPFYWEHNRVGMLQALLAVPFKHPFTNLLVQCGLGIAAGLANFFLLGYYVAGRRRGMVIGALGALWFELFVHAGQEFGYLINNSHYEISLALALLAMLTLRCWRQHGDLGRLRGQWQPLTAVVLIWIALWVNPSLALALGPLILLQRFLLRDSAMEFDRLDAAQGTDRTRATSLDPAMVAIAREPAEEGWRRLVRGYPAADWIALSATVSGLMISMALSRWVATYQERYAFLPPVDWLACAAAVCRNIPDVLHRNWLFTIVLSAASGLLTLRWPAGRQALRGSLVLTLALLIPALVQFAFMTSLNVVHTSNCPRYVFVATMLWQAGCLAFCVLQWTAVLPDHPRLRHVPYVLLVVFCLVAMARHGRSGLDVAREALDRNAGPITDEVLAARCTHVTGNYWHVWKTVYHANRRLADGGATYTVWGICQRCLPTADQWTQVPLAETRIAVPIGNEQEGGAFLAQYVASPMILDHAGPIIQVLRPTVALSEAWPARVRR
jgi:hypothetical protein